MAQNLRYTFSLISPFSYLGADAFFDMAQRAEATVTLRAVSIGKVFGETGGLPPAKRHPARQAYRIAELTRWKALRGKTAMNLAPKFFPADDRQAAAMVNAAVMQGFDASILVRALHRLVWEEEGNIADPATLAGVCGACGYDVKRLQETAETPACAGLYDVHTTEAIEAGIFGVPWYEIGGEEYWGQQNLDLIAAKLGQK